ncbi:CAP domain-containing protein [Alkalisalibacterium limincola]|uniref:CAP domain-containing protein n=1 Tax=Alkalisalibacterium limincola TaxID=2699169 RepID=A0A5C8KXN7_9GAMM|nr:CAP domain-containing protein [Alkalisalibacterium limincola]
MIMGFASASDPVAGDEAELVSLINSHRDASDACDGRQVAAVPSLAPDERLARLDAGAASNPMAATRATGYSPAKVQVIELRGPGDAHEAMEFLATRYCPVLLDEQFTDIGVARDGTRWQVVLARPLLDEGLGDWREAGRAILEQVNQARATARYCGSAHHDAAAPLQWSEPLAQAALAHGRDMAEHNFFSHVSPSGETLSHRVDQADYAWSRIGENIAAGAGSPEQAVEGWIDSPTHCTTLMNPDFSATGAAYAIDEQSDAVIYWVQVFGTPQ